MTESKAAEPKAPDATPAVQKAPEQKVPQSKSSEPKPPDPKPRRNIILPLVVVLVLAGAGVAAWRYLSPRNDVPDNVIALTGRIEGDDSAVSPKTSGRILEIRFREGDTVKAGDLIVPMVRRPCPRDDCAPAGRRSETTSSARRDGSRARRRPSVRRTCARTTTADRRRVL